jgi:hypothetical protein
MGAHLGPVACPSSSCRAAPWYRVLAALAVHPLGPRRAGATRRLHGLRRVAVRAVVLCGCVTRLWRWVCGGLTVGVGGSNPSSSSNGKCSGSEALALPSPPALRPRSAHVGTNTRQATPRLPHNAAVPYAVRPCHLPAPNLPPRRRPAVLRCTGRPTAPPNRFGGRACVQRAPTLPDPSTPARRSSLAACRCGPTGPSRTSNWPGQHRRRRTSFC